MKKVLVIDDETAPRETIKEMIKALGHCVATAESGKEGLDSYRNGGFDLVILDMIMPEMGGDEVFAEIREINPEAKIIIASGYTPDEKIQKILSQNGTAFFAKAIPLRNA